MKRKKAASLCSKVMQLDEFKTRPQLMFIAFIIQTDPTLFSLFSCARLCAAFFFSFKFASMNILFHPFSVLFFLYFSYKMRALGFYLYNCSCILAIFGFFRCTEIVEFQIQAHLMTRKNQWSARNRYYASVR